MNGKLSKSEFHAEYIHDIIEMEYKANALRVLAGECRKRARNLKKEAEICCETSKELMDENNEKLNKIIQHRKLDTHKIQYETKSRNVARKRFSISRLALIWFLIFIMSIVVMPFIFAYFVEVIRYEEMGYFLVLFIVSTIILTFFANWIFLLISPTEVEFYEIEQKVNYPLIEQNATTRLNASKKKYEQALEKKTQHEKTADDLYAKALYLEKQADVLDSNRHKIYALNIIPPDYRELTYLLGFYKIFHNDLADTMREAILIYEERDYRQKSLSALNRIGNQLGLISEYIMDMSDNLYRIGNDINFMSGEIQNIRAIQENTNDQQKEMIEEIRATRYANEAVQRSNEQCEWYLHHQYWDT